MSLRHIAALRAAYASRARHRGTATRTIAVGLAAVGMLVAFAACREQDPTAPMRAPRAAHLDVEPTPTVEVYVNGAPQSWQLFMGNRAVASLASGRKVVIVHTDAGDGGNGAAFWQARERGALASVDAALGASGAWTCGAQPTNSHGIQRCATANAVVYFMRMPDGNSIDGQGYGFGSMSRLRDLAAPTTTIDGSATYVSWADFVATLRAIVLAETVNASGSAIEVHSPDYDRTINPGDHPDNFATADAARAAAQSMGWTFAWYTDFQTINMPANVTGASLTTKQAVWTAYDNAMVAAGFNSGATDAAIQAWLQRTYFRVASTTPGAPSNLTAHASTKSRIDLQWTDNATNEAGFNIERAPNNAGVPGAFVAVGTVGANVAAFADLSASP